MRYIFIMLLLPLALSCSSGVKDNKDDNVNTDAATLENPAALALEQVRMDTLPPYVRSLLQYRLQKDRAYKTGEHSPLEADKKGAFTGLQYFAPDSSYRVMVTTQLLYPENIAFKTTTERVANYQKFADLLFTLKGKKLKIRAYVDADDPNSGLFIPFKDSTTGKTTYGGGRFIEMPMPEERTFELDFNLAFNPYCHYNHNYSCPLVPAENTLDIAIEAGEKMLY